MGNLFHIVMKVFSALLGVAAILAGGVWILQGTGLAFQVGFMAGDPLWAVYGAILVLLALGQIYWSLTRRR
jgi:hypothetical protein